MTPPLSSARNRLRALNEGSPVAAMAVQLFLYELAAGLLNRYWVSALVRIMGFLHISGMHPYLAACQNLALLLVLTAGMMYASGQSEILSNGRGSFFRGLLYGGWILLFSGWSVMAGLAEAEGLRSSRDIVYSMLYYVLVAVVEELVFRGIVANSLARAAWRHGGGGDSLGKAAAVSGIVFSAAHFRVLMVSGLSGAAILLTGAFIMGMLLSLIYLRTGNICSVIVLHAANDIAAAVPATVIKGGGSIVGRIGGYGFQELLQLIPCAVSIGILLHMGGQMQDGGRHHA